MQARLTKAMRQASIHLISPLQFTIVCHHPLKSAVLFTDSYCAHNSTTNLEVGPQDLSPQDNSRYLGHENHNKATYALDTAASDEKLLMRCEAKCRDMVGYENENTTAVNL